MDTILMTDTAAAPTLDVPFVPGPAPAIPLPGGTPPESPVIAEPPYQRPEQPFPYGAMLGGVAIGLGVVGVGYGGWRLWRRRVEKQLAALEASEAAKKAPKATPAAAA